MESVFTGCDRKVLLAQGGAAVEQLAETSLGQPYRLGVDDEESPSSSNKLL